MIEITDFASEDLAMYTTTNENQLAHFYEPKPGVFIAESPNVVERALHGGYEPISFLVEKEQVTPWLVEISAKYPTCPVYLASAELLKSLGGYAMTRGVLCALRRRSFPTLSDLCEGKHRIAVLENVMNPTNVGAIFRSAAALSMEAVLLTKGCADPLYRRASRVSMGTVFQVPWMYCGGTAVDELHALGFKTVGMALCDGCVSIEDEALAKEDKLAIILGTEGTGLMPETIESCDYIAKIPMAEGVDSLNVAAASAVAFWQLRRN